MSRKSNRDKRPTTYDREYEKYIEEYVRETGDHNWKIQTVARWVASTGRYKESEDNIVRGLIRRLRKAAGRAGYIDPETGKWIRKYLPYRLGDQQPLLWGAPEDLTIEQFTDAKTLARDNIASRIFQWCDQTEHYNRLFNTSGEPVLFDPNFTNDVSERDEPGLYDDTPPDDSTDS